MGLIRKILGPESKYDKSLPYTYMAKVQVIQGNDDDFSYYFADTICGLVEYMADHEFTPEQVELFGIYLKKEIPLDKKYCLSENDKWLIRPNICKSLEKHYKETLEEQYKGHLEKETCFYDDRDRKARGSSPSD